MLTCTLIATDQGLQLAQSEIEAVAAAPCLKVAPVLGRADAREDPQCLRQAADIFWYAGHMTPDGIPLADRTYLPPIIIGAYIAAFEYRLAVLNSCTGAGCCPGNPRSGAWLPRDLHTKRRSRTPTPTILGACCRSNSAQGGIEVAARFARISGLQSVAGRNELSVATGTVTRANQRALRTARAHGEDRREDDSGWKRTSRRCANSSR